ncbi:MAG TPA: hypothetical protein VFX70_03020 [Mycobacteriales bacterium]|nr:hypothetical protein [Mycobacteriales bacterium]
MTFTDTCTGIHAVFTSADQHTTQFVVDPPTGAAETVTGSGTRDYVATNGNSHLSVTFDGTSADHTWTQPSTCGSTGPGGGGGGGNPPPVKTADPHVSASNACKTGISVELDNMGGTAGTTFTVTDPDGNTHKVAVRAGQIVKKSYAVTEDTTGVVTVTAPGLAKKTVTYAKDCSTVLGEKFVQHPPTKKPVVQGEKVTQLPFTGDNTRRETLIGASMLLIGALICALAGRRRTSAAIEI